MFSIRCDYPVFRDDPTQEVTGRDVVESRHNTLPEAERSLMALAMRIKKDCNNESEEVSYDQEKGKVEVWGMGDGVIVYYISSEEAGERGDIIRRTWVDGSLIW